MGFDFEEFRDTLIDFSDEDRIRILEMLYKEGPRRQQDIRMALQINDNELHRDLSRFEDRKIVEKGQMVCLTPYGKWSYQLVSMFKSLVSKKQYFLEHPPQEPPLKFRLSIDSILNCQFIDGALLVAEKWVSMYNNADEYIWAAKSQVNLDMIRRAFEATQRDVKYKYILPVNVKAPPGRKELLQRLDWKVLVERRKIERRMLQKIPIVVILNEKEASVVFPNTSGEVNLNVCLYSREPLFLEWCKDYFEQLWQTSQSFDEDSIQEVV